MDGIIGKDRSVRRFACAGGIDGVVAAGRPERPVDLPHPGRGQVYLEEPLGVDADLLAAADQRIQELSW